jgi:hypothetical protein
VAERQTGQEEGLSACPPARQAEEEDVSHWLEDALMEGLTDLDIPEAVASMADHLSTEGEWRKGVISPSLVAVQCPLSRVKIFLGLVPAPGQPARTAVRAGRPDFNSTIAMVRGMAGEALILAAMGKANLPIVAKAPHFVVEWTDPEHGYAYAGHPDVLIESPFDQSQQFKGDRFEMIQIKTPTSYKIDRVEKQGDQDALKSYLPQMATEMFIARRSGMNVTANHLLLFSWDSIPKNNKPRVKAVTLEWHPSLATIPEEAARQIHDDALIALAQNVWPAAYPVTSWDVWPCSYCRYARLGDFEVPACDDHEKWRSTNEEVPSR